MSREPQIEAGVERSSMPAGGVHEYLVHHLDQHMGTLMRLRREFRQCSEALSATIASAFNGCRTLGEFEAPSLDFEMLRSSFERWEALNDRFEADVFDRFSGPAEGTYFRYNLSTGKQLASTKVYSYWGKTAGDCGRFVQKITGSRTTYVDPETVTDLSQATGDITVNVFRPDVGIVSIAFTPDTAIREVPAIGYQVGSDQLIWINQEMRRHLEPLEENVYLVSLEWSDVLERKPCFLIVAIRFEINFQESRARPRNTIWKLRYEKRDLTALGTCPRFQEGNRPHSAGPRLAGASVSLPDLNAGAYPFTTAQNLLDQTAYFNMFSSPEARSCTKTLISGDSPAEIIGFNMREQLRRFQVAVSSDCSRFKVTDRVGEPVGSMSSRWMLAPEDFHELPGREPSPTRLDASRAQRFVMLDGHGQLGPREDGFYGFGTGSTFPVTINGSPQLLVAAVGSISAGLGKFDGCEGTYTYCGSLSPESGFTGNVLLRVPDPEGRFRTDSTLSDMEECLCREPGVWYLLFRGQKADRSWKTRYTFGADGQPNGFRLEQELRVLDLEFTSHGHRGLRTSQRMGEVIGRMTSHVFLNLINPGAAGTVSAPITFQSRNEFALTTSGGRVLGSFVAEGGEGRSFRTGFGNSSRLPTLRFGAFQKITAGTGIFSGLEGLLTDNSIASLSPHVTSTLYVVRFCDPTSKCQIAVSGRSSSSCSVRLRDEEGQRIEGFAVKCPERQ
jgi:hypothetical protein